MVTENLRRFGDRSTLADITSKSGLTKKLESPNIDCGLGQRRARRTGWREALTLKLNYLIVRYHPASRVLDMPPAPRLNKATVKTSVSISTEAGLIVPFKRQVSRRNDAEGDTLCACHAPLAPELPENGMWEFPTEPKAHARSSGYHAASTSGGSSLGRSVNVRFDRLDEACTWPSFSLAR